MSFDDRRDERIDETGGRRPPVGLVAFAVVAVLAIIFILQNREEAPVDFLVVEVESRQWVIIAISIALGVLLDRLFLMWWRRRRRRD